MFFGVMFGRERNCVTRVSKHGCVFDGEVDGFVTNMFLIGVCCEELFVGVTNTGWGLVRDQLSARVL